jgi:hypothetical protein
MLGAAAVAIWCDVDPAIQDEFDDWHTHEHIPERLSIPGFMRGSRWDSIDAGRGRFILYELDRLETLRSAAYLERLNNPTPWSRKMMAHHLCMVRSLCTVRSTMGSGLAAVMLTIRLSPRLEAAGPLFQWLSTVVPGLPMRRAMVGAHVLQDTGTKSQAPTAEQKIRGGDQTAEWIVLVNGYRVDAVERLAAEELDEAALVAHGAAPGSIAHIYRLAYTLATRP